MRKFVIMAGVLALALAAGCASQGGGSALNAPPDWVARGTAAAYPAEKYIAMEGRGKTAALAEQDAFAALSRYVIAEVSSAARSRVAWSTDTGYDAQISDEALVRSSAKLFTVRRVSPWYDRSEKNYKIIAYIDRAEAWTVLEPRLRKETGEFRALWNVAESESAVLKSYFDYKKAQAHTRRLEFTETIDFGTLVNPRETAAITGEMRGNIAELSAKINEARNMAQMYIDCPQDFESLLATALKKAFGAEGLPITADKKRAAAVCAVTVDEGFQYSEGSDFYYPKISAVIAGASGGALFSYSAAPGKYGAMTAEVAKRRAYTALAADIENNFLAQMNKGLGVR